MVQKFTLLFMQTFKLNLLFLMVCHIRTKITNTRGQFGNNKSMSAILLTFRWKFNDKTKFNPIKYLENQNKLFFKSEIKNHIICIL